MCLSGVAFCSWNLGIACAQVSANHASIAQIHPAKTPQKVFKINDSLNSLHFAPLGADALVRYAGLMFRATRPAYCHEGWQYVFQHSETSQKGWIPLQHKNRQCLFYGWGLPGFCQMFLHVSPFFPFDYAFSGKPIRKHTSTYDDINAQICLTENGKNTRTKRKYLQKETKDSNKMQKQESKRSDTVFPSLQPSQNLRSFSPSHGLVQKKYKPLNARVNLLKWRCNKPCLSKTTHSGSTPDRVEKQSLTVTEYLPQLPGSYLRLNKSQSIFSQIFSLHFPSIFCESSILSPLSPSRTWKSTSPAKQP